MSPADFQVQMYLGKDIAILVDQVPQWYTYTVNCEIPGSLQFPSGIPCMLLQCQFLQDILTSLLHMTSRE